MPNSISFTVFSKAWKPKLFDLAEKIQALGFDAIELPVRPGFQETRDHVAEDIQRRFRY